MERNFALDKKEVEAGFVLTCQAHPTTERVVALLRRTQITSAMPCRGRAKNYDDQRELILARAATLFANRGYPGTSMNEVAQACGLSKATLYHYYDDKYAMPGVDRRGPRAASARAGGRGHRRTPGNPRPTCAN